MPETYTTTRGVIFALRQPPLFALQAVNRQHDAEKPVPPTVYIEEKARSEPNENDPAYHNALAQWQATLMERQMDALVVTGTEILEVPSDLPQLEDLSWQEILQAIGIPVAGTVPGRYIQWVKYVAAPGPTDITNLTGRLLTLLGVSEKEVAEAIGTFRSPTLRGTDSPSSPVGSSSDRSNVSTSDAGDSAAHGRVGVDGGVKPQAFGLDAARLLH